MTVISALAGLQASIAVVMALLLCSSIRLFYELNIT